MTGTVRGSALLLAALLLGGCGGDDEAAPATEEPKASAEPTPEATPEPVELEECRAAVDRADAIASEMETAVIDDAAQFAQLFDRLQVLQDQADTYCTTDTYQPLAKGVYKLALANAGYTGCEFVELCDRSDIERDLIQGTGLIHKAAAAAARTS